MPYADVNGQHVFYEDSGGPGPAVIFNHGIFMDHRVWDEQVKSLLDVARCITWDQRGHGQTRDDGGPFSFWDSAADLLGLLKHLDVDNAVLVGHSQGGFVSLRAALLEPRRVAALVIIASHGRALDDDTISGFRGLAAAWRDHGAAAVSDGLAGMLIGDQNRQERWVRSWATWDPDRATRVLDVLIALDDLGNRPAEITSPALQIHGLADRGIPVDLGRDLYGQFAEPRGFVEVEGAGHTPGLTHSAVVNDRLRRFVTAVAQ